jgi:hypothetical protein
MLENLPTDLLRRLFYFTRSPTAWLVHTEFIRRAQVAAQEEAAEEAWEDAAEMFYANQEAENERQAFAMYVKEMEAERAREARRASRAFL